ncbi:MAG: sensor domain-containing diguanylate cyclase [Denitrovibrio sp.]|nr:MAG: sensor domain-containing diguanylate cyclase [Denitrovibrio sp.]
MLKLNNFSKNKYYLQFAGYFLIFGIIVAIFTSFINYKLKYSDIAKELNTKANAEADFKKNYLDNYIKQIELMLSSIVRNEITKEYIDSKSDSDLENLYNLFYSLIYSNSDLMQLRLIDQDGIEAVRIDREKQSPDLKIILNENLQDKSSRYYFKEASQIRGGDFWHSRIDLNVEHGKIEVPLRPTFRVATPLILNNQFQGILIANVLMDNLLDVLTNSINFNVYLIDKDGEIIISPDHEESWSRYLENRPTIFEYFPQLADHLQINEDYRDSKLFMFSYASLFRNNEELKILFTPKTEVIGEMEKNNTSTAAIIALIVLIVSIPLSWVASIIPSRLQAALLTTYDEISKYTKIIDRNIPTSRTDTEGVITDVSSRFLDITGYAKEEIIGKTHNLLRHPETDDKHYEELWLTISQGLVWSGEMKELRKDGSSFWIKQTITPEFDNKGEIIAYTSIAQDITEKKMVEEMSITDSLTQIYNRHKLDDAIKHEVNRFNRYRTNFCAILIDIDHFKMVNDNYGHQAGDDVLVKLASMMKENTRETDVCGRWGGEEFLIIAVEAELANAHAMAEKLRKNVEDEEFPPVKNITISIGVAQYQYGETIAHFINRADDALYQAKDAGRNKVVISEV